MHCHQCPHAEAVDAGKFKEVPFKETPCAKCQLLEKVSYAVEFNENLPGGFLPDGREKTVEDVHFPDEVAEADSRLPIAVLRELVGIFLSLPSPVRDVVCWRFAGMTYDEIARRQRVTIPMVEKRQRRAMRRYPVLCELFGAKVARRKQNQRQSGRKTSGFCDDII